jgi:hypothetical protein
MKHTSKLLSITIAASLFAMGSLLSSCEKSAESGLSTETTATVNNESTQESQQDEVDDISNNQMANVDSPTGREDGKFFFTDLRCSCATITHDVDTVKGSGTIHIDFGTGCKDKNGNVRAGVINVSWSGGRWFVAGSVYTITFFGYSVNGVSFSNNDLRTVTNVSTATSPLTFNVVANHTLTWPDNTTATRAVHKTRQWVRSSDIVSDKFIITQTSADVAAGVGINRHGIAYSAEITSPLVYLRSCAISNRVFKPVQGTKVITYDNGKVATIDFGNGSCDATYTVTADGVTKTVNGKNDDSND